MILRTVLDELSEACGRQRQISDKSDALQRKLDRSDGLTMAEEGRQTVIVETEARICRLIELRRQLRRKEAEIVKICTECLMLDARNSIRDRAQVIAEDHRANAGCEWREANVAGTPSGRPRTGSVPGGRSRAVSRSSSTRSVLAGLSDSERRLWANLEINFSEVKLEKRIGAGAAGIVHRGTHLGQDVAVKILKAQEEMDDDERSVSFAAPTSCSSWGSARFHRISRSSQNTSLVARSTTSCTSRRDQLIFVGECGCC